MPTDAWSYYKKSIGSIRGQFNTNREAITGQLVQRGFGPQDETWISNMTRLNARMEMEERMVQQSTMAKRLQAIAKTIPDNPLLEQEVGIASEERRVIAKPLEAQLSRRAFPWELKLERIVTPGGGRTGVSPAKLGVERYTP